MSEKDKQEPGQSWAPLADVAVAYGVSIDTIRRRMKRGELEARRQQTPQGFKWLALMPEASEPTASEPPRDASGSSLLHDTVTSGVQVFERDREELVATLRQELALRNREIALLHEVIASQAKAIEVTTAALPTKAQTVEQPLPALPRMTGTTDTLEGAIEQSGTFWGRIRKWFAG
jgi:hypothetical protein